MNALAAGPFVTVVVGFLTGVVEVELAGGFRTGGFGFTGGLLAGREVVLPPPIVPPPVGPPSCCAVTEKLRNNKVSAGRQNMR